MPVVIDDVAQYLHNNSVASLGTSLFKSYVPETPDAVVAVMDTGGVKPSIDIPSKDPTFQVFIRSTNYSTGKTKLDLVRSLLHKQMNTQLIANGVYFYFIHALSEGGHLGRDENGKDLFSINFLCKTR